MKLPFTSRTIFGKQVAGLRKAGSVPVVCYGAEQKSTAYTVPVKQLTDLLTSDVVVVEADGDLQGKQVLLQDIDFHPVTGDPIHADFLFVDASREVEHEVPIRVEGEAPGVKVHEGQMVVALDKLIVRALPQNIPGFVTADVSGLEDIGSHLSVSNIPLPDNVTLVSNPEDTVISIVEQSQEEEEPVQEDENYLENIEVTGKGGKKPEDEEVAEEDAGEQE
ncbi:MAG: 50S ribosomal protein L25 [Candidatus Kaiserbacteria bacterium]|nr:50S ribosomal protein L25 [Candidatus Kaiserbacteria bacterium]